MTYILSLAIYVIVVAPCLSQNTTVSVGTVCPLITCETSCQFGFANDTIGCPTCQCFDPCRSFSCPYGYYCIPERTACPRPPCPVIPRCVPCLEPICPQTCLFGYKLDSRGCKTCECIDPCRGYVCPVGYYCFAEPISCIPGPFCGARLKCLPICPIIVCPLNCPYGFERDSNGCPTCRCRDPCRNVICPRFHYCVVLPINCITVPCPEYQAFCKSYCGNKRLLTQNGTAVTCTGNCGLNSTCDTVTELGTSFCCE